MWVLIPYYNLNFTYFIFSNINCPQKTQQSNIQKVRTHTTEDYKLKSTKSAKINSTESLRKSCTTANVRDDNDDNEGPSSHILRHWNDAL